MLTQKQLVFKLKLLLALLALQLYGCKKSTDLDAVIEQGTWNLDVFQITSEKMDGFIPTGQPLINRIENLGQWYIADTAFTYSINSSGPLSYEGLYMKAIVSEANFNKYYYLNDIAYLQGDKLRQTEISVSRDPSGAALQNWFNVRRELLNSPGYTPTYAYFTSLTDGPYDNYQVLFRKLSKNKYLIVFNSRENVEYRLEISR